MKFCFIYCTTSSAAQARRIGKSLVASRLVACVNILSGMNSLYWWEGAVQDGREAVLIAKTRASLAAAVIDKIKSLHTYTVPCIVSLPVAGGNPDFLKWLKDETRTAPVKKKKSKRRG